MEEMQVMRQGSVVATEGDSKWELKWRMLKRDEPFECQLRHSIEHNGELVTPDTVDIIPMMMSAIVNEMRCQWSMQRAVWEQERFAADKKVEE